MQNKSEINSRILDGIIENASAEFGSPLFFLAKWRVTRKALPKRVMMGCRALLERA